MERKFYTMIKFDHPLGRNEYVQGRIAGYKELLCDGDRNGLVEPASATFSNPDIGMMYVTICDPEKYEAFKNLVEMHHPGLCEFDCYTEGNEQ